MSGLGSAPLALALAFVTLFRFGHAFTRLRRRGRRDHAGWGRVALFAAGISLATLPLVIPAESTSLSLHMLEHVLIGDAAAALLLLSLRGPLLFFMLPRPVTRTVTRSRPLRALAGALARPGAALGGWALVYAVWHIPGAFELAGRHEAVHTVQHASFVGAGLLVWTQLVDPAGRRALSVGERLAFAGALFACGQVLSTVLLVAPEPLFPSYAGGRDALADQQLAGIVMMVEQLVTLGLAAVLLVRSTMRGGATRVPAPARA